MATSKTLAAAGIALSLVAELPPYLRSLADQVVRSASSVSSNLAEGQGRFGPTKVDVGSFFASAAASEAAALRTTEMGRPFPTPAMGVKGAMARAQCDG